MIKIDIFFVNVYVFIFKGEVIELFSGGILIDFVYKIYIDVGYKMVGVIVNNCIVILDYEF